MSSKEKRFILVYPFAHLALSVIALLMTIADGIGPNAVSTPAQDNISAVGQVMFYILFVPYWILDKIGIGYHSVRWMDYLFMFVNGIAYGFTIVLFHRALRYFRKEQ